jgi:membrane fusion protein
MVNMRKAGLTLPERLQKAALKTQPRTNGSVQPPPDVLASPEQPPLFRSEVVTACQTQWLGTVLLAPRLSYGFFTAFAVLTTGAILGLLCFADYPRTARINGWLVPQQGLVRVMAPQTGVVTQLSVHEGVEVHKGEPLLMLSAELHSTARGATQTAIVRQLVTRHSSLAEERHQQSRLLAQQLRVLSSRLGTLQVEQVQLEREIALQGDRVRLAEKSEQLYRQLRERGLASELQAQQAEEGRIEQAARLSTLERSRIVTQRDRLTLEGELKDLPFKAQAQMATIERNSAEVEQQLAEVEARREIVVAAPQTGTVTAIQAESGGTATTTVPLLSIVPAGAQLEAHLFSPSRAIGFVQAGQRVLLRYEAYPYQKFGHYEGVVTHVSRSAISPGELPPQLAGLTSLYGANEPVYRLMVSLESQMITAYGQPLPLQPGMQLEADVVIDRRRLIEWLLDPLFTLTGKWNR